MPSPFVDLKVQYNEITTALQQAIEEIKGFVG
jgi:hypothetical protein